MKPGEKREFALDNAPGEGEMAGLVFQIAVGRRKEGMAGTVLLECPDSSEPRLVAHCKDNS